MATAAEINRRWQDEQALAEPEEINWWPEDYVELDVSALSAKTASPTTWGTSNTVRLQGEGDWIATTGFFQGCRITNSPRLNAASGNVISYPIAGGQVFRRPGRQGKVRDFYCVKETSGQGLCTFALFKNQMAAELWSRMFMPPQLGAITSFDAARTISGDSNAAPTTADVWSWGVVFSDAAAAWARGRQPNSWKLRRQGTLAASLATTGTKVTRTAANDGILVGAMAIVTASPSVTAPELSVRIGGNIMTTNLVSLNALARDAYTLMASQLSPARNTVSTKIEGALPSLTYGSGDTLDINCTVADATGAGAADVHIFTMEDRYPV